jgi:hypothetical protein
MKDKKTNDGHENNCDKYWITDMRNNRLGGDSDMTCILLEEINE